MNELCTTTVFTCHFIRVLTKPPPDMPPLPIIQYICKHIEPKVILQELHYIPPINSLVCMMWHIAI